MAEARASKSKLDKMLYAAPEDSDLYTGNGDLMGTWEVAFYLGVEKSRIARWLEKGGIDAPVARLKSGPFWTLAQVRGKARQMYEQATHAPNPSDRELDRWLNSRRERRVPTANGA